MRASRFLAVAIVLSAGCGGGGALIGNLYRDDEASYRIGELGAAWRRLDLEQNDLAWHNGDVGAIVQVNATCDPLSDAPLSALTNHLLIGFTDREFLSSEVVPLDGREALRSHVTAKLDGVPRELLFYVLKKDECTYDFALVAPPGDAYTRAEQEFERFVASFTTDVPGP
jgi:hypothetical protein